jgi:hypothetical protein
MNEIDLLKIQLATLTKRVKALEQNVRPLMTLQGVDTDLIADQALVSFAAESIGSTLPEVTGKSRTREATAARRRVAQLLRERAQWTKARIARNLNTTESGVRFLLKPAR